MGFPLTHAARGRRDGRIFALDHKSRATSLSPSRQFPRVTDNDFLAAFRAIASFGRCQAKRSRASDAHSVHAPMVLPCSGAHEICRTCVAALRKVDGTIQCPKCREDATGAVNPNRGLIAALRLSRR